MNKPLIALTATAALTLGACSQSNPEAGPGINAPQGPSQGEAPDSEISPEVVENLEKHAPVADRMYEDGGSQFVGKLAAGVTVSYDKDNCVVFERPEGDVVVKNPAEYTYSENQSKIKFFLYTEKKAATGVVRRGPFEYTHPDLKDVVLDDGSDVAWPKDPGNYVDVQVTSINGDGKTAWLQGKLGEKVSETIIIHNLSSGQPDVDRLNKVTEEFCGKSVEAELMPEEQLQPPETSTD